MARRIELWPLEKLRPYDRNPRTHSDAQIEEIAASIAEFGFNNPILVDTEAGIVAGHGRLLASQQLGLSELPVVVLDHLSPAQRRAYIIADNRIAENAGWDEDLLAGELAALAADDFDLGTLGFSKDELSELLDGADAAAGAEGEIPEPEPVPAVPVTRPGDLWELGPHRLLCGDSLDAEAMAQLMAGEMAALLFTDPPYNVAYGEKQDFLNRSDRGRRNNTPIEHDQMDEDAFKAFLSAALATAESVLADGAAYYICAPPGPTETLFRLALPESMPLRQCLVWSKDHFVLSRQDYHGRHESILYGWKAGAGHYFVNDRSQDTVWEIPRPKSSEEHPTMKPVELVERAIRNSSRRGDLVLDSFGGSGTTLLAAERTQRHARLIELAPGYVDVAVRRWEALTGSKASLAEDGRAFHAIQAERQPDE